MTARSLLREQGNGDVHDPDPMMMEPTTMTPDYASGVHLYPMGEVISLMPWTDMPSYLPAFNLERRIAGRFFVTRTTARKLWKDLGAILNAGN